MAFNTQFRHRRHKALIFWRENIRNRRRKYTYVRTWPNECNWGRLNLKRTTGKLCCVMLANVNYRFRLFYLKMYTLSVCICSLVGLVVLNQTIKLNDVSTAWYWFAKSHKFRLEQSLQLQTSWGSKGTTLLCVFWLQLYYELLISNHRLLKHLTTCQK